MIFGSIFITNPSTATSAVPPAEIISGQVFYRNGLYQEAVHTWNTAIRHFKKTGDQPNQALILSYLALAYQQNGQLQQAQSSISQALELIIQNGKVVNPKIGARIFNNQGELLFNFGDSEAALNAFQQAQKYYSDENDSVGIIGTKINSARALQMLGFFLRAKSMLEEAEVSINQQPDSELKVNTLLNLGNVLRVIGNYKRAREVMLKSYQITNNLKLDKEAKIILLNLGKLAQAQNQLPTALDFYQQAAVSNSPVRLQACIYQLELITHLHYYTNTEELLTQIHSLLTNYPLNQTKVYAQIELASTLTKIKLNGYQTVKQSSLDDAAQLLANAYKEAHILGHPRAESVALGRLGSLYEQTRQWQEALALTQQALDTALSIKAVDIAYQWEWQLGRIYKAKDNLDEAITHYTQAYQSLQSLRQDLVAINQDIQFSFRESVEPVYRELVDLLLQDVPNISLEEQQTKLISARETIEALQMAEIANYFRQACLNSQPISIEQIDAKAAVIYPIILNDRIEVILSLPNKPLRHYATLLPVKQVETAIKQMRHSQRRTSFEHERLLIAQKIYTWLIQPAIPDLTEQDIKTLVFVLDGSFRNLPMSALYDGKQYLIEKFQIAVAPSLELFEPGSLSSKNIKVLAAGITLPNQDFSPLPGVEQEINLIRAKAPTTVLLNHKFTIKNLQAHLQNPSYSIIHLASHGQFSSNSTETFIQTWNELLDINTLNGLIVYRNLKGVAPIELLVLSACQTAKGDNSAALGIAGVAAHSGARSILASLWQISDESTVLFMNVFYKELLTGATKAEAMRKAQLELLKNDDYQHPYYWASFILVGNWL
ncbi:MAG: CHAT domain-containing protein [Calothrix sp. C42_A2020_038]|nr:CHAT domain-containing protein [Calothrix sp. C42_A2020_038]